MKTATLVEAIHASGGDRYVTPGDKAVYKLSEPYKGYDDSEPTEYLYVSTASVFGSPETYAFPANEKGEVTSWTELPCSTKGDYSHADVLRDAGYELVEGDRPPRAKDSR
jgi:hypothetical protein